MAHGAHLTVGLWYLLWYGSDDGLERVRAGIRRYNVAHSNEPMRVGYHKTMTRFWLWMIEDYLGRTPIAGSLADLANGLIAACVDHKLPFRYYSRERFRCPTRHGRRGSSRTCVLCRSSGESMGNPIHRSRCGHHHVGGISRATNHRGGMRDAMAARGIGDIRGSVTCGQSPALPGWSGRGM